MENQIIKATITGPSTVPSLSSDLPIPPKQIADSAIDAAGAALAEIYFSHLPFVGIGKSGLNWKRIFISRKGISKEQHALIGKGNQVVGNHET